MPQSLPLLVLLSLCSLAMSHDDHKYHFINESKSWSDAQNYCRQNYTDLATVHNMEDVKRLSEAAKGSTDAWIGLNQTSDRNDTKIWHWSLPGLEYNGSNKNWKSGEPNDIGGIENCGFINEEKLLDGACNSTRCFICFNGSSNTYHLNTTETTWLKALHYCRENHTDLISGRNQLDIIGSGLEKCYVNGWWIGLFRDTWGWSDGSNSSFRNWDDQDDVLNRKLEDNKKCAKLGPDKWRSAECTEANPFICYDDRYILVKENRTWEEALYYCRQRYRDLAWITNKHQEKMVKERAKMADTEVVWLGLYYTCFLEEWVWVNGHYVSNGKWKDPGPNVCEVSGAMEKGGENQWVKKPSEQKLNFVCAVYF